MKPRPLIWACAGTLAGTVVLLIAWQDHYLRHERWTDFRLLDASATEGREFVKEGSRLALNPQMARHLEARLSADEVVALWKEARSPFAGADSGRDWFARICSVTTRETDAEFPDVRVRVHLADPDLAERVGRMVADEVLQFGSRIRMEEAIAQWERHQRETAAQRNESPEELEKRLRRATAFSISGVQKLYRLDRFYPKSSEGKVVLWNRLADVLLHAAVPALLLGLLAGLVTAKARNQDAINS